MKKTEVGIFVYKYKSDGAFLMGLAHKYAKPEYCYMKP
jgi:hypothetical protein